MAACLAKVEALADEATPKAVALAGECVACPGAPPAAYRLQASLQSEAGDVPSSRVTLLAGVRVHRESAPLWLALGRLELSNDRPREGIAALARARTLNPADENIADELDHALARHGTKEEKIEAKVRPLLLEATGRYELEDVTGATRTLETALKMASGAPRAEAAVRHRLGLLSMAKGDVDAATEHFQKGLALVPEPITVRSDLLLAWAEVLLGTDKIPEAIEAARGAAEIEPMNPLAHTNLAVGYAIAGEVDRALAALGAAASAGLARRLTKAQVLGIPAFAVLADDERFTAWVDETWSR